MPELPDVEGFRRVLERAAGARIDQVDVLDSGVLRDASGKAFANALVGQSVRAPRRHGKWLVAPVSPPGRRHRRRDPSLVFHFGMTGELTWAGRDDAGKAERHRHDRFVVGTDRGELRYRDQRKLQGVRLSHDDGQLDELLADLGPDATEVTAAELEERLRSRSRQLKTALMDQTVVAGLGNLLADEICWRARVDPRRRTDQLTSAECRRLHGRARTVLRNANRAGRVPDRPSWLTGRRDHPGATCPRCGERLASGRVNGRTTVWCRGCQSS